MKRDTIPTPQWATDLAERVFTDHDLPTVPLRYFPLTKGRVGGRTFYGLRKIEIYVGDTDTFDARRLLLHELAHWWTLNKNRARSAGHTPEFWDRALAFYAQYLGADAPRRAMHVEASYRRQALSALNRHVAGTAFRRSMPKLDNGVRAASLSVGTRVRFRNPYTLSEKLRYGTIERIHDAAGVYIYAEADGRGGSSYRVECNTIVFPARKRGA
jgi:hypothetical protein